MRLLRISSKDRTDSSISKYNFTFATNDYDLHQAKRIMLKSAIIPNTQYNIHIHNNTFRYFIGGVFGTSLVLPVGQYTITTLIDALTAAAVALGMTIVQDPLTLKLVFTTTTPITYLTKNQGNFMAGVLGITSESTGGDVGSYSAPGLPNLIGLRHLYIASSTLSNNTSMITDDKQKLSIFADIPITVEFGGLQDVDNDSSTLDYTSFGARKNISTIDINLIDEHNETVDLNGHDFILVFAIFS